MTRNNASNSLAHRRGSQRSTDRYHDQLYPPSITIPYSYNPQGVGLPFSSPPYASAPAVPPEANFDGRRPPFKHMQSSPAGLYTLHQDTYQGQWPQNPGPPHYNSVSQQDFHHNQEDTNNPFWKLSVTSPTTPDHPHPRPPNQWIPNPNNNYTHERPQHPGPHHESHPFAQPQYFPGITTQVPGMQPTPPTSQSSDDHCEPTQWSRTAAATTYRSGATS